MAMAAPRRWRAIAHARDCATWSAQVRQFAHRDSYSTRTYARGEVQFSPYTSFRGRIGRPPAATGLGDRPGKGENQGVLGRHQSKWRSPMLGAGCPIPDGSGRHRVVTGDLDPILALDTAAPAFPILQPTVSSDCAPCKPCATRFASSPCRSGGTARTPATLDLTEHRFGDPLALSICLTASLRTKFASHALLHRHVLPGATADVVPSARCVSADPSRYTRRFADRRATSRCIH